MTARRAVGPWPSSCAGRGWLVTVLSRFGYRLASRRLASAVAVTGFRHAVLPTLAGPSTMSPNRTPSGLTSTISSRLVGRFLPT